MDARATAGPGLRWVAPGLLVVVAVGLAVATGFLAFNVKDAHDTAGRRSAVLSAAKQEVINVLNVDYKSAQQSSSRVLAGATGQFKDQWGGGTSQIVGGLVQNKAKESVTALDAGLVSMSGSTAEVIASATAVVTSPQNTQGVQRTYRIDMQLQRKGGRWLTSTFGFVT